MVSELFDPTVWEVVPGFTFRDITYHRTHDRKTVRVAFNRPEVRNAFNASTYEDRYKAI